MCRGLVLAAVFIYGLWEAVDGIYRAIGISDSGVSELVSGVLQTVGATILLATFVVQIRSSVLGYPFDAGDAVSVLPSTARQVDADSTNVV